MVRIAAFLWLMLFSVMPCYSECPSIPRIQVLLNRTLGILTQIKEVKELPSFNSCMVKTASGETLFLSNDGKYLIEGILVRIPSLKFGERELQFFKEKTLFRLGKGKKEIFLFTNPLCEACRKNRKLLAELSRRYEIYVIPLGFKGKEFKAAVSAYCMKLKGKAFFNEKELKVCDEGKLKVWSIADKFKRMGITGTPVAVLPSGKVLIGVEEIRKLVQN